MEKDIEKYFTRIDTTKLCPWFYTKLKLVVGACVARGYEFWAISGLREYDEQMKLYGQGREFIDGKWVVIDKSKVVTNALPWTSFHFFGLAVDFCLDKDKERAGLQPDYDVEKYKILQEELHKVGLISGLDFKSFPEGAHAQTPIRSGSTGEFKQLWLSEGPEAVWNLALNNLKLVLDYKDHYKDIV